jgi:hypothetical protein
MEDDQSRRINLRRSRRVNLEVQFKEKGYPQGLERHA